MLYYASAGVAYQLQSTVSPVLQAGTTVCHRQQGGSSVLYYASAGVAYQLQSTVSPVLQALQCVTGSREGLTC